MLKYCYVCIISVLMGCNASNEYGQKERIETIEHLVWLDDFDRFDESKWTAIEGDGCPEICGFGNNELQYYSGRPENVKVEDGKLKIIALKDSLGSKAYSSAKLISKHKGDWQYGRVEVKAKVPDGRGTWAAIWMLPTLDRALNWPLDGEMDIMEHVGYNSGMVYGTIHTKKYNHLIGNQKSDSMKVDRISENFHIYGLDWSTDSLTWSIDGREYLRLGRGEEENEGWPFDQSFHLILNLAVGGNWGGKHGVDDKIWPQVMEIDYVKVYQIEQ